MKTGLLIICTSIFVGFAACNSPAPTSTENSEATATTDSVKPAAAIEQPYDPDPTDTIPAGQYGINSSSKETAELVRTTLVNEFKDDIAKSFIDTLSRKFIFFEYDLNGDGKKEIFVGLTGHYFCGSGGCTQYLLDDMGNTIAKFTVAGYPVVIDNNKTNGWNDLFIHSGSKDRIVKFDGKKYPSNPSTLPALTMPPGDGLPRALDFEHEPYPWFRF